MVKIKIKYAIIKEEEIELTTREYYKYQMFNEKLKDELANKNNVNIDNIYLDSNFFKIIDGELNLDDLDK